LVIGCLRAWGSSFVKTLLHGLIVTSYDCAAFVREWTDVMIVGTAWWTEEVSKPFPPSTAKPLLYHLAELWSLLLLLCGARYCSCKLTGANEVMSLVINEIFPHLFFALQDNVIGWSR
jgi:hypothetical protein